MINSHSTYSRFSFAQRTLALFIAALMVFGTTMGCAASTQITSEPSGAALRIDGAPVGETPHVYDNDSVWVWTKHNVILEKRGYETQMGEIKGQFVTENVIIGAVGGLFCLFPAIVIFMGTYNPVHHYVLRSKRRAALELEVAEDAAIDFN